jgi:SH3-like domain-containing protein
MEKVKKATTEVKEATTEVATKLRPKVGWVSLRETLCSEGFDEKRGWRRMAALWGAINAPFCR